MYLFIPTIGSKLWRTAYRFDKKIKLLSFGEYPVVSLKKQVMFVGSEGARYRDDQIRIVVDDQPLIF